jgi:hypothetical protein
MHGARSGLVSLGLGCSAGLVLVVAIGAGGCSDRSGSPRDGAAGSGGGGGGDASIGNPSPLVVSTTARHPRTTTMAVNYWQWAPAFGNYVAGTESLVAAVAPALMRVGGYNNDANTPNPFDDGQLDTMVAYARAVGAEPILQVPLLADTTGQPPTADTAAAMVRYANVTQGYGVKYFSIGNEPDLYDSQGLPSAMTQPAIPGYMPADYCVSARAYVTAMKAVDPTIQIVGPDLAYKYQAGNGTYDWLTPVLQDCGDLFDIVSIHRYPFEAKQAALSAAASDAAAFRSVIASVRGLMQAAGHGDKPLALTEMNVVYDSTGCVLDASPGTVGSALWLADILGSAMTLDLWTSAVWNISDVEGWSLGIIGAAPQHEPRPEYYTYALYADHFGPTLLDVTTAPAQVSAYASRNGADDATEIIAVNWGTAPAVIEVQVTGLAAAPAAPVYVLPAVSLAAIEIPDSGAASAWIYSEAQRLRGAAPEPLAPDTPPPSDSDGGAGTGPGPAGRTVGSGCQTDGPHCAQTVPTGAAITTMGSASGATLSFGPASEKWVSYSYAASGQTAPTGTVTADGNGLQITGGFVAPVSAGANFAGLGLYYSSSSCLDGSTYHGIQFDFSGDLGGCRLGVGIAFSGNLSSMDDATRGACAGTDATCYAPSTDVTVLLLALPPSTPTIQVPFSALVGGMPNSMLDPTTIISVQWQLSSPLGADGGGACAAAFTVENVSFY